MWKILPVCLCLIVLTGCGSYKMDEEGQRTKITVPYAIDAFCYRGDEYLKNYKGGVVKTGHACDE